MRMKPSVKRKNIPTLGIPPSHWGWEPRLTGAAQWALALDKHTNALMAPNLRSGPSSARLAAPRPGSGLRFASGPYLHVILISLHRPQR